jgi:transcriptional regulator with XRE-family HTH domain
VESGIGATLREARSRRKLDLAEVEAAIKIRVRYLQAIENEEWDVLPGVAYTRGFIRTYAIHLGLDGERLADEYKRTVTVAAGERTPKRVEPVPASARGERRRVSGGLLATGVVLALAALAVAIGLVGGEDGTSVPDAGEGAPPGDRRAASQAPVPAPTAGVALSLAATAEVWVCLVDAGEDALIDGEILSERAKAGPFRSRHFEVAFGNGSVEMTIDGREADLPPSSSPIGYEIDSDGELSPLDEGERPDCE